MVIVSPRFLGLFPLQMAFLWLIHGGDPNHLLTGMILQVFLVSHDAAPPYHDVKMLDFA